MQCRHEQHVRFFGGATRIFGGVTRFLVEDERNPSSILSGIHNARENARTVREVLPMELWERINKKYAYTVEFDGDELIKKSIDSINAELRVATLSYTLTKGEQEGTEFNVEYTKTKKLARSHGGFAEYDIIGKIAEGTTLTRRTVTAILKGISRE